MVLEKAPSLGFINHSLLYRINDIDFEKYPPYTNPPIPVCYPTLTVFIIECLTNKRETSFVCFRWAGRKQIVLLISFIISLVSLPPFRSFISRINNFNDLKEIGNLDLEPFAWYFKINLQISSVFQINYIYL